MKSDHKESKSVFAVTSSSNATEVKLSRSIPTGDSSRPTGKPRRLQAPAYGVQRNSQPWPSSALFTGLHFAGVGAGLIIGWWLRHHKIKEELSLYLYYPGYLFAQVCPATVRHMLQYHGTKEQPRLKESLLDSV